jgi:hypothetical protein
MKKNREKKLIKFSALNIPLLKIMGDFQYFRSGFPGRPLSCCKHAGHRKKFSNMIRCQQYEKFLTKIHKDEKCIFNPKVMFTECLNNSKKIVGNKI